MRAWIGLLLVAGAVQGCGRVSLDDPIDLSANPAGSGGMVSVGGRGGEGGHAGAGGAGGVVGHAGAGGVGGIVGHAGAGGQSGAGPPSCVPGQSAACACATGATGAQVCDASGTFGSCTCVSSEFQRVRDGMVGVWLGTESTPFTPPFQVQITFSADGRYSAGCGQGMCPAPVFYYGSDADDASKTYALTDLHADGTAFGHIMIFFMANDVQTGDLDAVTLSADGTHLQFQFWSAWIGRVGPFVFDLHRSTP